MDVKTAAELDEKYIAKTYGRFDLAPERGSGAEIFDSDGKRYIDCGSGIAVNLFGICDEKWKEAVKGQIDKIQHISNLYYSEPQIRLARMLCEKTGASEVFFGNSGAEANECAIKAARKYGSAAGRYEIITLKNSFHGRTMATITATGQEEFHEYFGPFLEGFRYADPTPDSVAKCVTDKTCAIMIETVQCEGGVIDLDEDFLKWLDAFCQETGILLIVDEVQTGNGRTGYLYSYAEFGLRPDIVTTAKGIGGGLPLGVCMFFERCAGVLTAGTHGSTFGGNAVACAGACSIVERLTGDFLAEVRGKAAYFRANLSRIKKVKRVTGRGLVIGLDCDNGKSPKEMADACLEKGLLVLTAHDKVRLLPPLTIKKEEIDEACKILEEVIDI
ncbi:MAG: acetylornithine/succinylornithine family transaminase [Clostridia bacterium]|nr:acetylornithine/succinylornithine family transaminase [Clostridia bacterium]